MEQIVQQIAADFVKKIMGHYSEKGIYDIGAMADDTLKMAKDTAKELLGAFIADADASLVLLRGERMRDGIKVHERDVGRTLLTSLGEFTYRRTYFKTPDGMEYLLDRLLGVEAYERVDAHVSAGLANESGRGSFGKSADIVTGGAVSRQTAWRKAMESGEVAALPERIAKTPERIHIFADEDHAHLQDGHGAILPVVTVCSGKRRACEGRNELIGKTHLCGYGLTPETFWGYVYAVCEAKYDMSKVKEVFIYGDGAKWIEASGDCFPGAVRVLDAYHYEKKMRALTAGDVCGKFAVSLRTAVSRGDKEGFDAIVSCIVDTAGKAMVPGKERDRKIRSISEAASYLLARWDAVMNMRREGSIGSCTEAMVSHVLSERFSRSPMGWSKHGIAKMAQIRVYQANGGRVLPSDIGAGKGTNDRRRGVPPFVRKYEELVKRQQEAVFAGVRDWRVFEHEHIGWAAPSGTKVALDALARMRNIA
jgi:hypothetical protein